MPQFLRKPMTRFRMTSLKNSSRLANIYLQPGIVNSESQNPFSPKKSDTGEM